MFFRQKKALQFCSACREVVGVDGWMYKGLDFDTRDLDLHPKTSVWLGSGECLRLGKDRGLNKINMWCLVLQVTFD